MKTGILGGTFDPVHLGHTGVAEAAAKELGLDRVLMMPVHIQPFKQDRRTASAEDRVAMLALAVARCDKLEVSTYEIENEVVSYTYDTIRALSERHPEDEICFIMGSDSLMSIDTWYKGAELLGLCSFAVGLRPGDDRAAVEAKAALLRERYSAEITLLQEMMLPVSSTQIRELVERGEPIYGLVAPEVEVYIDEHDLYL